MLMKLKKAMFFLSVKVKYPWFLLGYMSNEQLNGFLKGLGEELEKNQVDKLVDDEALTEEEGEKFKEFIEVKWENMEKLSWLICLMGLLSLIIPIIWENQNT